ncbi:hypothetical protein COT63_01060 [Candidatus Shapirobacteria bacterium CG09_land_8_20_14_0_10_38_17]|uniref:Uncharacterized protein n=1 Tax=Candidatus Shapirobacteria bacterium CG09_land_8_20_14_0_10_38_17 TaxID=1974884 RepID=A0A2H0WTI7_9BACT|nr:MAG: hypothetical protein COT63_01060 [Candidatus Shapirobacteria bacterium CG09_land_8_20_14_0_10_38_17]
MKEKRGFFQKSEREWSSTVKKGGVGRWRFLLVLLLAGGLFWGLFNYGSPLLLGLGNLWRGLSGDGSADDSIGDNIPPPPPQIAPLPEATNSASLEVVGSAELDSTLILFLNGVEIKKILIGNEGEFRIGQIKLNDGENNLFAKAVDLAGNESQESVRQIIFFDKEPPTLKIESPQDGDSFFDDQKEITIKGETEKDAIVNINERKVVVSLEGKFESVYSLSEGTNEILVISSDKAGNKAQESLKVYYRP